MRTITHQQLHDDLSRILGRAEQGETFEITMDDHPVARLSGIGRNRRFLPAEEFVRTLHLGPDPTFAEDTSAGIDHAVHDPFLR